MRISVVMPVYNQAHLVSNAINSILNQTHRDFELIIVDDGSTDNLVGILAKFKDSRIILAHQKHSGLVDARNNGTSIAHSEIIAIQDADDLSMPDRLEKCIKAIKEGSDVVYHGAYINMWDNQFQCIGRKYLEAKPFNKYQLLQGQYIPGWLVFRKKVWEAKRFRKETEYMYDWMMCLDWAFSNYKFKAINEGLYEYVRHENSASIQFEKDGSRLQSYIKIKEIMKDEYRQDVA